MKERLVDAVDRIGLDARGRRIVLTMPGILFGFYPGHHAEFVERIDCPTCSWMMDLIDEAMRPNSQAFEDDRRLAPVRARNAARKAAYERRRAWPLVGRLVPVPTYEPEPTRAGTIFARLDALKAQCPRHWGDKEAAAISERLMGSYVRSDRLVHGTASV